MAGGETLVSMRRDIQTRMFDSARWDHVALREDDIVVATWAKSGTTLTQQMIYQLVSGGEDGLGSATASPWVDVRFMMPLDDMVDMLDAQAHRRFMKTHLPFEATPFSPTMKYVYIGRDGRDVLWSVHNHCNSFTETAWNSINAAEGPWPKWSAPTPDVRQYYLDWLETDTTPGFHDLSFWSHVQSWWDQRRRPNILLLHYANLIDDLPGGLRRLAQFLEIDIDEARFPAMIEHCCIDYMREQGANTMTSTFFENGAATFFNKGTNGRWRDVLSPAEIARCDAVAAERLTPDCAHWLKTGELPD